MKNKIAILLTLTALLSGCGSLKKSTMPEPTVTTGSTTTEADPYKTIIATLELESLGTILGNCLIVFKRDSRGDYHGLADYSDACSIICLYNSTQEALFCNAELCECLVKSTGLEGCAVEIRHSTGVVDLIAFQNGAQRSVIGYNNGFSLNIIGYSNFDH